MFEISFRLYYAAANQLVQHVVLHHLFPYRHLYLYPFVLLPFLLHHYLHRILLISINATNPVTVIINIEIKTPKIIIVPLDPSIVHFSLPYILRLLSTILAKNV